MGLEGAFTPGSRPSSSGYSTDAVDAVVDRSMAVADERHA